MEWTEEKEASPPNWHPNTLLLPLISHENAFVSLCSVSATEGRYYCGTTEASLHPNPWEGCSPIPPYPMGGVQPHSPCPGGGGATSLHPQCKLPITLKTKPASQRPDSLTQCHTPNPVQLRERFTQIMGTDSLPYLLCTVSILAPKSPERGSV